ncbi:hypothetical protein, partial [Burkholderia cenocepacia]|uniref:hypothetical protein n=1 Tax=Burkholderia cenocepacia TaxID=95486 RepID=UPI00406CC6B1
PRVPVALLHALLTYAERSPPVGVFKTGPCRVLAPDTGVVQSSRVASCYVAMGSAGRLVVLYLFPFVG